MALRSCGVAGAPPGQVPGQVVLSLGTVNFRGKLPRPHSPSNELSEPSAKLKKTVKEAEAGVG